MRKWKRAAAIALTAAMGMSTFAGCGQKEETKEETTKEETKENEPVIDAIIEIAGTPTAIPKVWNRRQIP